MRTGHRAPICSLAVSSAYAVAVSGDEDSALLLSEIFHTPTVPLVGTDTREVSLSLQ
jgi:hypothetical protein